MTTESEKMFERAVALIDAYFKELRSDYLQALLEDGRFSDDEIRALAFDYQEQLKADRARHLPNLRLQCEAWASGKRITHQSGVVH